MNRTKIFLLNSLFAALLQTVVMIAGFITPRIMLKYYGSEINGLVSSISQFITYFSLVEAGLAGAAIYALYKPLAEKDNKAINAVVTAARKLYLKSGYIFLLLSLCLAIVYPIFIKSSALSPIYIGILVIILCANGILEFFTLAKYRVLLSADQKTYIISLATISQIIVSTLVIVCLSSFSVNIVIVRLVAVFAILLRSFILMTYVRRKYKFLNYNEKPNYGALDKRWNALYLQILGSTQLAAPIILATIFTSLQTVSVYAIYNMVLGGIGGILSIFINGLSATFGDIIARGENKTLKKAYNEFEFSYYILITIIYAVSMVLIMPFIRIYTTGITDINYNVPLLGYLFVINGWLYNIKTPQGMLVISAGLYKETRIQSTIQAAIIIVLGIILAPKYGLIGILIASCLSNLYRDIDLLFFIPKYVTGLQVKDTALRILRMFIAMFIIWVPFIYIEIRAVNLIQWCMVAVAITIYAILVVGGMSAIFDKASAREVYLRLKAISFTRFLGNKDK